MKGATAHESIQPRKQAAVFQPPCESGRKRQGQEQEPQAKEGEEVRYGLPYKGSKNAIAEFIVNNLPRAHTFCDLFFGGGAITHRALLTREYEQFIVNDIDGRLPKFFLTVLTASIRPKITGSG